MNRTLLPVKVVRWILRGAGVVAVVTTSLVTTLLALSGKPAERAVVLMGATLFLLWGGVANFVFRGIRPRVVPLVRDLPGSWRLKFVLFCTLLAMLEEAITVSLTNLAPWFGTPYGTAYITASGNYFDVVALHSVAVFVPMFVFWAWWLGRYQFSPDEVFLLFGITGGLAELGIGGHLAQIPFWIFIYGPMIYLPAWCVPDPSPRRRPRWIHAVGAILLPFLAAVPVAGLIHFLHPIPIHFPPIGG